MTKIRAQQAHDAAVQAIQHVAATVETVLDLTGDAFSSLDRIPAEISTLPHLQQLSLNRTTISDLAPLGRLYNLRWLALGKTAVRDITPLSGLKALQSLFLNQTSVSDLSPLAQLTQLQRVALDETAVYDLAPLAALTGLKVLSLYKTQVSDLVPLFDLVGLQILKLNETQVSDLTPLTAMTELQQLWLENTLVEDLTPLVNLAELNSLRLNGTQVSDLAPLADLKGLRELTLSNSGVSDLRPLLQLSIPGRDSILSLAYVNTPATQGDPVLRDLSRILDARQRANKTFAYLATLPPWPQPLELDQTEASILTVEAVLKSQSPLGWRFSPADGAMEVYAEAVPTTAMQAQLAMMSGERAQSLKLALAGANHGLRGEARMEVDRFTALLEDRSRPLSIRSVELWGSLVAMGGLLDGNDLGRVQGRDPLDLLSVEQRATLQTLLQIAGNFVRSFPDVKVLDDSAGGFLRREISTEMVASMIEAALRATYVTPSSAALMQHVAAVGAADGPQADKATSVSVRGIGNLIQTATLIVGKGTAKLAGAAAIGAAGYVGAQAADHYDLDEAAFTYIKEIKDLLEPFLSNLPPDEAAVLQSNLRDTKSKLDEWARQKAALDELRRGLDQDRKREGGPFSEFNKS